MKPLTILGCDPSLLNVLMELAEDAQGMAHFDILLNIPVKIGAEFQPHAHWQHRVYTLETLTPEHIDRLRNAGQFAFSVSHHPVKTILYEAFKNVFALEHAQFPQLIHPSAVVSRSANVGFGVHIDPNVTISACSRVGFGVNIKRSSSVGHHCILEDFSTLNPGVTLSSFVHVGKGTRIGAGTVVRDNVSIGENCMIGMGSVVTKDIPANSVAYGNPCRVQRQNALGTL